MSFLDDACRRGVLRHVGAAYQFRHLSLQQALRNPWENRPPRWMRRTAFGRLVDRVHARRRNGSPPALRDSSRIRGSFAGTVTDGQALTEEAVQEWLDRADELSDARRWDEVAPLLAACADAYGRLATHDRGLLVDQALVLGRLAASFERLGWREESFAVTRDALKLGLEIVGSDGPRGQAELVELVDHVQSRLCAATGAISIRR